MPTIDIDALVEANDKETNKLHDQIAEIQATLRNNYNVPQGLINTLFEASTDLGATSQKHWTLIMTDRHPSFGTKLKALFRK